MRKHVLPQPVRGPFGARCRSWRPRAAGAAHPQRHLPGACRVCWRPCLRRVPPGETRCADCGWALAQHPDPRVRLALVAQPRIPADVLELLVTDPDPLVADRAERLAAFRGISGGRALATGRR